jgi:hypothetical protein
MTAAIANVLVRLARGLTCGQTRPCAAGSRHIPKREFESPAAVHGGMWRMVCLVASAACASYRALPLETPPSGPSPLTLRYEQKRMHLFASTREDARIEAVFASGRTIAALVSRPADGVFVSMDGGSEWTFAQMDDRFRDVMFDGPLIVGRGAARLHCSKDGGKSWRAWIGPPIDAVALAAGAIYTAASGHLYVSDDCAQSWKTLTPQIPGAWRARSIAVDGQSIYMSIRATPETAPLTTLLDGSSDAARAALSFVDGRGSRGPAGGDAWVSHDGGALWQRTSLGLDAWLAAFDGQIWAVAADPMIEGAALVRRSPLLAAALDGQLQGARVDAGALRASFTFPGRDKLLRAMITPVFRSADEGMTWIRMEDLPIALRTALARQRAAQPELERAPEMPRRPDGAGGRAGSAGHSGGEGGRVGRRGGRRGARSDEPSQSVQRRPRTVSPETFFALVDPLRLLARFNAGRALTGVAGDKILDAYAPTRQFWDSLVDAIIAESDAEGEIALSPGTRAPDSAPDGAFELLFSTDRGASWSELDSPRLDGSLHERAIAPYPVAIAATPQQAFVLFAGMDRGGQGWRDAWRWAQ